MRVYPLHYYNEAGWLKVPVPLWLVFIIGVQHLWFFSPAMHKVLPIMAELLLDLHLLAGDVLVIVVLLAIGHRMSSGGLNVMRAVWKKGWFILIAAYLLTISGFVYRQHLVLSSPDHPNFLWALLILAMNILPFAYLVSSRHARDVFSLVPVVEVAKTGEKAEEPQGKPVPAGVLIRQREAKEILSRHPVSPQAPPGEQEARARLELDLEYAALWHDLGIFYFKQNEITKATDFVRHASQIDSTNALYLRNLAELCRRCGLLQEALIAGRRAARLAPQDPEAHYNLAVVYSAANKINEAIESYKAAIALKPDHALAQQNLSHLVGILNKAH